LTIVELNNGTTGNPGNLAGLTLGVDGSGSPSENIIIDNNAIVSQYNVSTWTQQDWQNKALSHAITEGWGGDCTAITNNKISNVGFGIAVNGTHVLVHGNTIDHFGDDGIDLGVESGTQVLANIEVSGNTITNNLNIGDANHNDAFQGWVLNGTTATNIVVDSNTIMVQTDPTLPWVGDMQGISEFDGAWSNVTVSNNVVLGGAYHGIAFYDATNLTVVNNTVFGTWGQPASNGDMNECWIGIFGGSNITVRNNVTDMISIASGVMVTQDHNLVTTSHPAVFNSFNLGTLDFDLHPLASASLLIGEGSPTLAPSKDITGATRSGSITIGAYQNP
jgi:parallel beta-helix repeat protein